jgi:hypothetical protein
VDGDSESEEEPAMSSDREGEVEREVKSVGEEANWTRIRVECNRNEREASIQRQSR